MPESMIYVNVVPTDTGLGDLISGLQMVSSKYLPNTVEAMKAATAVMAYTWKSYAMGAPIPGTSIRLHSVRGGYARSIKSRSENLRGAVWTDSPYASSIEDGTEAKDLKKIIPLGPKARMGKNGPYSIVPFRHGTPKSLNAPMPQQVYALIQRMIKEKEASKRFRKSAVTGKVVVPSPRGGTVQRNQYRWGSRYKSQVGKGKNPEFPNLEGMVVFDVSSGERETRGQYVTFRIITLNRPKQSKSLKDWNDSWVVPAKQGYHLTKYVVQNTRSVVEQIMRAGVTMDLLP